jgi:hypothetical protein
MRIESSVTSVSWIPSEVPTGLLQAGINLGLGHADPPPPEVIDDLDALFAAERFRFANHLAAWIEVADGRVIDAGYSGRGYISCTRLRIGGIRDHLPASRIPRNQAGARDHRHGSTVHSDNRRPAP